VGFDFESRQIGFAPIVFGLSDIVFERFADSGIVAPGGRKESAVPDFPELFDDQLLIFR
jgi:hypothetical protein